MKGLFQFDINADNISGARLTLIIANPGLHAANDCICAPLSAPSRRGTLQLILIHGTLCVGRRVRSDIEWVCETVIGGLAGLASGASTLRRRLLGFYEDGLVRDWDAWLKGFEPTLDTNSGGLNSRIHGGYWAGDV